MKSAIKVELGTLNKPVIRMRCILTDDVRDVLFYQFSESFGGLSTLCHVDFVDPKSYPGGDAEKLLEFTPVPPLKNYGTVIEHLRIIEGMEYAIRSQSNAAWVSMCITCDVIYWEDSSNKTTSPTLDRRLLEKLTFSELHEIISKTLNSRDKWSPDLV